MYTRVIISFRADSLYVFSINLYYEIRGKIGFENYNEIALFAKNCF